MSDAPAPAQSPSETRMTRFGDWLFKNRVAWLLAVCVVFVGLDQGTKIWAQGELAVQREVLTRKNVDGKLVETKEMLYVSKKNVEVIPKSFNLIYRENPAAAFSLTRSFPEWLRRPFLIIFSSLAMILIGIWYFRLRRPDGLLMVAFSSIIAGAIGNFIDRVRFGYVVDFLDVYAGFINQRWPHWPTFNIADSCIVVGALLVVYRTLKPLYPPEEDDVPEAATSEG
jgi:lipoprotein signal peptidase